MVLASGLALTGGGLALGIGGLQRKVDANGTEFVYGHDANRRVTQITATPVQPQPSPRDLAIQGLMSLLFTGAYILKAIKKVLHGPLNEHWAASQGEHRLTEINTREILVMAPLMVLILWIGVWPAWVLNVINNAVIRLF